MEEVTERFREYLATPEGLTYLARRVRVGARAEAGEALRLDAWLKARSVFSPILTDTKEKGRK